ncbi:hypothetical protein TNCV_2237981 [Trichonephila clavipes]|nr:hypothetical protein TNCV_2237981 [Trichonephila clavipes]
MGPVHQGDKRKSTSSNNTLTHFRKRVKREERAVPGTSRYNLRPRRRERVESRPSSEKRTHQRGLFRSRKRREQQYSPYNGEQGRSCDWSTRKRKSPITTTQGEQRMSEQSQIPVARSASRRRQLQDTIIRNIQIMATSGSSLTPTPPGHEDNLEVGHHLRANALQWNP